jgi:hypothetical protein
MSLTNRNARETGFDSESKTRRHTGPLTILCAVHSFPVSRLIRTGEVTW